MNFLLGGYLLNFVGGTARFMYGTVIRKCNLTQRKSYSYNEYLNGPDKPDDFVFDGLGHSFGNKFIGFIVIVAITLIAISFT